MECLLVKKINLDGDESTKTSTTNQKIENLEDAEIANQLYNLHTKILRMFILTAFDMSRDILITPKRIMYAKEKENELYEQLMIIAKEKQQEIRMLIASTIDKMKDQLIEKAANYVFKVNTNFNLPAPSICCSNVGACQPTDCCLTDCLDSRCLDSKCVDVKCSEDKCDSVLTVQSNEDPCWCTGDEPDFCQQISNQPQHDRLVVPITNVQATSEHQISEPQANRTASASHDKLRRHHSMHSHLGNKHICCHRDLTDPTQNQPERANSQQHHFKHSSAHFNCNQQQTPFNSQSHNQYTSCDYADSGCASGNCCSCEPFVNSDLHQRHLHRNSQLHSTHQIEHNSSNHLIGTVNHRRPNSPARKESLFKRFTNKFSKETSLRPEEDYSRKVIEQLNELQIKDKQDYEDLKNHLNHLNRLHQLNRHQQQLEYYESQNSSSNQLCAAKYCAVNCHSTTGQLLNSKQTKITLKDLCAAQNEVQEHILSLLNNQIANDIVRSVNILKKNYIGTLERCLTALESGVSSIAQREQLTTALAAAVEYDSPTNQILSTKPTGNHLKLDRKSQQTTLNSYASRQTSLDCDCTLNSNGDSSTNSSFDDADDESTADYSLVNRTHHEASDALRQILTAAYQVEINLKTNSGFFKLYWDKIRQLVFNCTVTLWKLNYANPKPINGLCTECYSNLSLIETSHLAHSNRKATNYCNSCPPIICTTSLGSDGRTRSCASLECCELNCCSTVATNCDQSDCHQAITNEDDEQIWTAGHDDDDDEHRDDDNPPPEFRRLRQTSLDSYVKIEQNQFLDSHCSRFTSCPHYHQLISAQQHGLLNSTRLQVDSIIDWKRKVALEVLSNLNLTRLSKSICGQFKDKLKQSHEQFAQAIRQLEQLHLEKRKRTEQQRLNLRKCFAPKIARFALESICLKDLINHGMPKLGEQIFRSCCR